jgi:hypothetical protein
MHPMRWPARLLLAIGAISASVSFWAFSAQRTILDPTATRDLATALIDTGAVTDSLSQQIADQLERALPADVAGQLPARDIERIANAVVEDPRVAAAFSATIESAHEQLLRGDRGGDLAIDSGAINRALRDTVSEFDPALGARISEADPIGLTIDGGNLPSLQPVERGVDTALLAGAVIAIMAFGLGVAIHPEPWRAVAIVGRRLSAIALMPIALYLVVPGVLRSIGSDRTDTLTPFATAYGARILPAAIALTVGGVALWVGGFVGQRTASNGGGGRAPGRPVTDAARDRRATNRPRPTTSPTSTSGGRTDLRL